MMNKYTKIGLTMGIIGMIYYAIATLIKYYIFSDNLFIFSLVSVISFVFFIILWVIALQWSTKHQAIMDIAIKDLFRTVFIVIILGELGFGIVNYLFPFHIQPDFFAQFYERNKTWMALNSKWPKDKQDETLASILNQKSVSWKQIIQGFGQNIIIDSIIAFVMVMIFRRVKAPIKYSA